ncbi:hypothetical protein C9374_009062 [Naegleria lovaniensis]|uniref:RGS domain-containing protein n=1 Tax=Naegleria lovaniensis TaxID=51637 RepID=A0AA88KGW1_NAELO|nr:uncharacterized protein C9374_009062 [Naegleria lovaniensis]KAG2377546.1 hypothetical protein C9374_009062 [Naegleria lovaniensis]
MLFTQSKNSNQKGLMQPSSGAVIHPKSKISKTASSASFNTTDFSSVSSFQVDNTIQNRLDAVSHSPSKEFSQISGTKKSSSTQLSNPKPEPFKLPPLQLTKSTTTNPQSPSPSVQEDQSHPLPPRTPRVINVDKYFTLSQYIQDEEASQVFLQFLKKKRCEESLEFLLQLNALKKIPPHHTQSIEESLQQIRKQFLVSGAVSELNVGRAAKVHALERMDRFLTHQLGQQKSNTTNSSTTSSQSWNSAIKHSSWNDSSSLYMSSPSLHESLIIGSSPNSHSISFSPTPSSFHSQMTNSTESMPSFSTPPTFHSSSFSSPEALLHTHSMVSSGDGSLGSSPITMITSNDHDQLNNNNNNFELSALISQSSTNSSTTYNWWNTSQMFKELEFEVRLQLQNESFKEFKASDEFEHFVLTKVIEQSLNHKPNSFTLSSSHSSSSYQEKQPDVSRSSNNKNISSEAGDSSPSGISTNSSSSSVSSSSSSTTVLTSSPSNGFFSKLFKRKESKQHSPSSSPTILGSPSAKNNSSSYGREISGDSIILEDDSFNAEEDHDNLLTFIETVPLRRWTSQQTIAFFQLKLELPEYVDQIKKHDIKGTDLRILKKEVFEHRDPNHDEPSSSSNIPFIHTSNSNNNNNSTNLSSRQEISEDFQPPHLELQQKKMEQLYKKLKMVKLGHKKKLIREVNQVLTRYYLNKQKQGNHARTITSTSTSPSSLTPTMDVHHHRSKRSLSQPQELVLSKSPLDSSSLTDIQSAPTVIIKLTILPLNQKRVFTVKSLITMDQFKECILREISDLLESKDVENSKFFENRPILSSKGATIHSNEELKEFLSQYITTDTRKVSSNSTSPFAHIKIEI